jgi:hypothetical protein
MAPSTHQTDSIPESMCIAQRLYLCQPPCCKVRRVCAAIGWDDSCHTRLRHSARHCDRDTLWVEGCFKCTSNACHFTTGDVTF